MKVLRTDFLLSVTLLFGTFILPSAFAAGRYGDVQLIVIDSHGTTVTGAPVYIYGQHLTKFGDVRSGDKISLPEGDYDLSAAFIQKTDDGIIPQQSPLAHIHVLEGDTVSVILPLANVINRSESVGPLALK